LAAQNSMVITVPG